MRLQWTDTKATLENLIVYFLEKKCAEGLTKNIVPFLSKLFHGDNNVQSTYITFDIFNNLMFIGTTEKANEK